MSFSLHRTWNKHCKGDIPHIFTFKIVILVVHILEMIH